MLALERHRNVLELAALRGEANANVRPQVRRRLEPVAELKLGRPDHPKRAADRRRPGAERVEHFVLLRDRHARHARLHDPGLFARDLCERVAQDLRVLELDRRDRRNLGRDHVGRVQAPAQPNLDHANVDRLVREIAEAHRGGQFKERGRAEFPLQSRRGLGDAVQVHAEVRRRHLARADAETLAQVDQVGAGVEPHRVAAPREGGGCHLAGAPLALRARDVDQLQPLMRVAQRLEQGGHPVEREHRRVNLVGLEALDVVARRQVVAGLLVGLESVGQRHDRDRLGRAQTTARRRTLLARRALRGSFVGLAGHSWSSVPARPRRSNPAQKPTSRKSHAFRGLPVPFEHQRPITRSST